MGNDISYARRQSQRDQQYAEEYTRYMASLSPEARSKYEAAGLGKPRVDGKARNVGLDDDLARFARVDADEEHDAPVSDNREPLVEQVQIIASIFISAQNLRMEAVALAFATGLGICSIWGGIQSQAARKLNLPRQNLNKSIKRWQRMLNLSPNHFTHPNGVSEKLSRAQKEKHWRKAKFKAGKLKAS